MTDGLRLIDLGGKKEPFTTAEIKFLKKKLPLTNYAIWYGIYRKDSKIGKKIVYVIDQMNNAPRKSGVENQWEIISKRLLTNKEYQNQIENFGCNHARFEVHFLRHIERIIEWDKSMNAQTPEEFIKTCKKRGYSGAIQTEMKFKTEQYE